jgi:hypothetical protein
MEIVEKGVMVMKGEMAWGQVFADGRCTVDGWTNPASGKVRIFDPKYCKKPTDVTHKGSEYFEELSEGKLVSVTRITKVYVDSQKT